jgi:hypothetical protein
VVSAGCGKVGARSPVTFLSFPAAAVVAGKRIEYELALKAEEVHGS